MKKYLYLLCLISNFSSAQSFQWAMQGKYSDQTISESVGTDKSGNVYVTGRFIPGHKSSAPAGGYISKYNNNGTLSWTDTIMGIKNIKSVTDSLGNTYAVGYLFGSCTFGNFTISGTTPPYYMTGFMVKYNSSGECVWAKNTSGHSIALNPEGGLYVSATNYGLFSKFDENGNILWTQNVTKINSNSTCYGVSISTDLDGNIYLTGQFSDTIIFGEGINSDTISYPGLSVNHYIAKYTSAGVFVWVRTPISYGVDGQNPFSVSPDALGNCYITANFDNTLTFGDTTFYSPYKMSFLIAKYNTQGSLQWAKAIIGTASTESYNIISDKEGYFYITGAFKETTDFGNNTTVNNPGTGLTGMVAKFNSAGEVQWVQTSEGLKNPNHTYWGSCIGYGLAKGYNNDIYMSGRINGSVAFGSTVLDAHMYPQMFVAKIGDEQITAINTELSEEALHLINIYPNPSGGLFTIWMDGFESVNDLEVSVKNVLGQVVYHSRFAAGTKHKTVDLGREANGLYFVEIIADRKREIRKIVVQ